MVSPAPALGTVRVPSLRKPGSPARPGLGKDSLIKAEVHEKAPQQFNYPLQCPPGTLLHHQRLRNVPKGRAHSPCLILKEMQWGVPHTSLIPKSWRSRSSQMTYLLAWSLLRCAMRSDGPGGISSRWLAVLSLTGG